MNRKWKIAAVLLAAGLLAGCGQEQKQNSQIPWESRESVETEIEEIDFSASQYFWDSISRVQRGKEGYYWLDNSVLRYKDWKTGQIVPLCNKPECRHGEDGCNAKLANMEKYPYLSPWEEFLRYCDDKLYLIMDYRDGEETVLGLFEIQTDGSGIQLLQNLYRISGTEDFVKDYYMRHFQTDHGYAYYAMILGGEGGYSRYEICRTPLTSEGKPEVLCSSSEEDSDKNMWINYFCIYKGNVYFSDRNRDERELKSDFYRYDIAAGEKELLMEDMQIGVGTVAGERFYFPTSTGDPGILELDLETGKVRQFLKEPEKMGKYGLGSHLGLSWDGEYLYAYDMDQVDYRDENGKPHETIEIFVLDLNGNLIQVLEAPNGDGYFYPYWGDQEILLVDQADKFVYYDKKGKVWKEWEG